MRERVWQNCALMTEYKKTGLSRLWGEGCSMIDRVLISRLLCVAAIAAIMLPAGHLMFPYVSDMLSSTQFQAVEAVLSATVGFGLSAIIG
jgi:hypothetical protein